MVEPGGADENRPLRGVIVGLGMMGAHHLRILASLPEVEVIAVVDPDENRREELLRCYPRMGSQPSLEQALEADSNLDFVCLAVPVPELPRCTATALEAGLHVFVEKPMAPEEGQAREMIAAADERDLVLGVGYVERFNPAVIALKERLDAGTIGAVVQMHARRLSPFPNRGQMTGVALDLATHDLDIMRNLCGSEIERVYAESVARVGHTREADLISATLRFDSGVTGLLEANWITPTKVRELSVLGEGGLFIVNYLTQDLRFYEHPTKPTGWDRLASMTGGSEGDMVRYALNRREPLRLQWEAFIDAAARGQRPPVDGRDGAIALSGARAIETSGAEHRVIVPSYREATVA